MRFKFLFSLLLCISFLYGTAQQAEPDFTQWPAENDSTYSMFAKKGYMRNAPGLTGIVIDSLTTGDRVRIKAQTEKFDVIKNINASWVKVVNTATGKEGYIWQGLLSVKETTANGLRFLYGIDRVFYKQEEGAKYAKLLMQVKAITADSVAAITEFETSAGEAASYTEMKLLGDPKLQNLQNVVRISLGGEACGIPTYYFYFGWTGKKFLALPGKYIVGDADVFYHSETLLFPNEKGGQPGKIIKLTEEEETLEEATAKKKAKVKHTNSKEVYVWDGEKAILQK